MELATTVLIASSVVVLILQIITIAMVVGLKNKVKGLAEEKPAPSQGGERHDRRDQDFRRNRRPQEQRPGNKPQVTSPVADPVEKSLRDINLRLKNAERDQEFARKRMNESFQKDGRRDGDRDRDRDRGGRGRDNRGRDHRRDGRDNRDRRRGNWQENRRDFQPRPNTGTPIFGNPQSTETPQAETTFEVAQKNEQPQQTPVIPVNEEIRHDTPDLSVTDLGVADENLQHGRKILVKRRALNGEALNGEEGSGEAQVESTGAVGSEEEVKSEQENAEAAKPTEEIRFGRR